MVMREAATLVGIGLVLGAVLAALASTTAKAMLFGLSPNDPTALALAIAVLALVGLVASYLPAQRAGRIQPTQVLPED